MLDNKEDSKVKVDDGTVTVPAGFQIAQDSGNTIEEGIVIEDIKSNQFVWVPVRGEYKRNITYTNTGVSAAAYTDTGYLPDGIQQETQHYADPGRHKEKCPCRRICSRRHNSSSESFTSPHGNSWCTDGRYCRAAMPERPSRSARSVSVKPIPMAEITPAPVM